MKQEKEIDVYTDGACSGNPGPGGYAALLQCDGHQRELSGGFAKTTNNRMELLAAITGLASLTQPCRVALHSDSKYLVDAMINGWVDGWRARGWVTAGKKRVKNVDLWQRLADATTGHEIDWVWVRGHDGHAENERCDILAVEAAAGEDLPPDEGYLAEVARDSVQLDLLPPES